MLLFNKRKRLADMYEEWLKENPIVKDCPLSVISYIADLFDEDKVIDFIEKQSEK